MFIILIAIYIYSNLITSRKIVARLDSLLSDDAANCFISSTICGAVIAREG